MVKKEPDQTTGQEASAIVVETEDGQEEKASSSSKRKKFIILGSLCVVVITASVGAWLMLSGTKEAVEKPDKSVEVTPTKPQERVYLELDEFLVNLNSTSHQTNFLKLGIALEVPSAEDVPKINANMLRIRDTLQVYLRELRVDDLKGSQAIYRLRQELLLRINKILYPVTVQDILFKEMLVQ